MANTAGGRINAASASSTQPPYPLYYSSGQMQAQYQPPLQRQPYGFQYYAPPPPPPPAPPQAPSFTSQTLKSPPSRPPPPPPGESSPVSAGATSGAPTSSSNSMGYAPRPPVTANNSYYPPLQPPPLPPMFPWMSPALTESMTNSEYGKYFKEEACNLPFVPILVNDEDLAKMTDNVIREAEGVNENQLKYYKDAISQDLPKALTEMFQPLYCKLCILTLSSPIVAKDHYSGKRHKKSIEAWFIKNPHLVKKSSVMPQSKLPPTPSGTVAQINGYVTPQSKPSNAVSFSNAFGAISKPRANIPPLVPKISELKTTISNPKVLPKPPPPPPLFDRKRPASTNSGAGDQKVGPSVSGDSNSRNDGSGNGNQNSYKNVTELTLPPKRQKPEEPLPTHLTTQQVHFMNNIANALAQGTCQICNVTLSSEVMANQHFKGKNHTGRVALLLDPTSANSANTIEVASLPPSATGNRNTKSGNETGTATPGINQRLLAVASSLSASSTNAQPKSQTIPFDPTKGQRIPQGGGGRGGGNNGGARGGRGGGGRGGGGHFSFNRNNNSNNKRGGFGNNRGGGGVQRF